MADKFIVTGAAGFIGSNIVAGLNRRGETDILAVDELGTDEKWKNLLGLEITDYWEKDDFLFALRNDSLGKVDTVFHLGANSSTTEKNASHLVENNYRFTRELCEWCMHHDVRFVYASSAATYGDGSLGYSDADDVTPTLRPLNMYGYSKQLFDLWALRHDLLDRIVGIKYFNVYGPREDHKGDMRSVVNKAYRQILETGEIRLFTSYKPEYKDGEQVRDFVYVDDAVEATLFFHDQQRANGLFNCGTGTARTWNDLAKALFAAMGRAPKITYIDMPETLRAKYQYHTQADVTKLRDAGCTVPFRSIEDGVREYVQSWLSKQP